MSGVSEIVVTNKNSGDCFPSMEHYVMCGLHEVLQGLHLWNLKMYVKLKTQCMLWMGEGLEIKRSEWSFQKLETVEEEEAVEGEVTGMEDTMVTVVDMTGLMIFSEMMTMAAGVTVTNDFKKHGEGMNICCTVQFTIVPVIFSSAWVRSELELHLVVYMPFILVYSKSWFC